MMFPLQPLGKFRAAIRAVALTLALSFAVPMSVAQNAGNPAPIPAATVAQSAQSAASDPVGDSRPATLGDLKELRQEMREENHKLRESMDVIWATMVLGFVANFAATIALAAVILQRDRQTRAQNNPHSPGRPVNQIQDAPAHA